MHQCRKLGTPSKYSSPVGDSSMIDTHSYDGEVNKMLLIRLKRFRTLQDLRRQRYDMFHVGELHCTFHSVAIKRGDSRDTALSAYSDATDEHVHRARFLESSLASAKSL